MNRQTSDGDKTISSKWIPHFLERFFQPAFPNNAITITADHVAALRVAAPSGMTVENSAFVPLAPGVVKPSSGEPNIADPDALHHALTQAAQRTGLFGKEVNLLIPDITARVFLVTLESLPKKAEDLAELLRFKVKKSVPFPIEEAALACEVQTLTSSHYEVILTVLNRSILREYENAVEALNVDAGFVTVEHFGVAQLLDRQTQEWGGRSTMLVRLTPRSMTTSIYHHRYLRFYRTVEKNFALTPATSVTAEMLFNEVYPSLAYFQDKFQQPVELIYLSGLPAGGESLCAAIQKLAECPVTELRTERAIAGGSSLPASAPMNQAFAPLIGVELGGV